MTVMQVVDGDDGDGDGGWWMEMVMALQFCFIEQLCRVQ